MHKTLTRELRNEDLQIDNFQLTFGRPNQGCDMGKGRHVIMRISNREPEKINHLKYLSIK